MQYESESKGLAINILKTKMADFVKECTNTPHGAKLRRKSSGEGEGIYLFRKCCDQGCEVCLRKKMKDMY